MLKLLIADSSEEFRFALAQQLAGSYAIRMCRQGKEALEMFYSFKPDVMVVDLMLPELDGISLLQQIAEQEKRPQVLATTRFYNDYVLQAITRLGVGYLIVKPCDVRATAARLQDLTEPITPMAPRRPDVKTEISNVLLQLGIPTKLRGYTYLREAVAMYMQRPGQMVTKEIYPAVGKLCDASWEQVERSIRSAVGAAYERRDEQHWRRFFQPEPGGGIRRPSNSVFISTVANALEKDEMFVNNLRTTGKTDK